MHTTTLADTCDQIRLAAKTKKITTFRAERALTAIQRIANSTAMPLSGIPALDVIAQYEQAATSVSPNRKQREINDLNAVLAVPQDDPALAARIASGRATLADALILLPAHVESGKERRNITTAVTTFASKIERRTGQPLSQIIASEENVNAQLERLSHTDFSLQPHSWGTFQSRIRRCVRWVDIKRRDVVHTTDLSVEWRRLVEAARIVSTKTNVAKIWPLVVYAHKYGLSPTEISDETVTALINHLTERRIKGAFMTGRETVYAWENLQAAIPDWPQTKLQRRYQNGWGRKLHPFKVWPEHLQQSWWDFVAANSQPKEEERPLTDLIEDGEISIGEAPAIEDRTKFSELRLLKLRTVLGEAILVAQELGIQVRSLADVASPAVLKSVLDRSLNRQVKRARIRGEVLTSAAKKNHTLWGYAANFIAFARAVGRSPDEIEQLAGLRDAVDPRLKSRSIDDNGKVQNHYLDTWIDNLHLRRLRQFSDERKRMAWFNLPLTLWARAQAVVKSGRRPTPEEIVDMMVCVTYAVLYAVPLRTGNLSTIRYKGPNRTLFLPATKGGKAMLRIPGKEVKNGRPINAELSPFATKIVQVWLDHFRPCLVEDVGADPANCYLFPAKAMKFRTGSQMNAQFLKRNWRIGGFELNIHCQRHLAAKLILDRDPTAMKLVQQILGHKHESTTRKYYAEVDAIFAQRVYQKHLLAEHRDLLGLGV